MWGHCLLTNRQKYTFFAIIKNPLMECNPIYMYSSLGGREVHTFNSSHHGALCTVSDDKFSYRCVSGSVILTSSSLALFLFYICISSKLLLWYTIYKPTRRWPDEFILVANNTNRFCPKPKNQSNHTNVEEFRIIMVNFIGCNCA